MKMKRVLFLFCVFVFAGWFFWCCDPPQSFSKIPEIHFKSLEFKYITTGLGTDLMPTLIFSFIDGDGDIGVSPQDVDSISRIHYTWYQKLPEGYVQHQFQTGKTTQSSAIPYEEVMNKDDANNKTLKGTIKITFDAPTNIQGIDTMRIEFFIVDRARNKSNVEFTPDFSILNPPIELPTK